MKSTAKAMINAIKEDAKIENTYGPNHQQMITVIYAMFGVILFFVTLVALDTPLFSSLIISFVVAIVVPIGIVFLFVMFVTFLDFVIYLSGKVIDNISEKDTNND